MSPTLRILARTLLAVGLALLAFLSLTPDDGALWPGGDKARHILAYLGLALVSFAAFRPAHWPLVIAGLFLGGIALEGAQAALTQSRTAAWADVAANALGLAGAAALAWCFRRIRGAMERRA